MILFWMFLELHYIFVLAVDLYVAIVNGGVGVLLLEGI